MVGKEVPFANKFQEAAYGDRLSQLHDNKWVKVGSFAEVLTQEEDEWVGVLRRLCFILRVNWESTRIRCNEKANSFCIILGRVSINIPQRHQERRQAIRLRIVLFIGPRKNFYENQYHVHIL